MLHYPAPLLHAFLFYLLCASYHSACASSGAFTSGSCSQFLWLHVALLVFNAAWLTTFRVDHATWTPPERVWIFNNVLAGALMLGLCAFQQVIQVPPMLAWLSVAAISLGNSAIDLVKTSDAYALSNHFTSG